MNVSSGLSRPSKQKTSGQMKTLINDCSNLATTTTTTTTASTTTVSTKGQPILTLSRIATLKS
jgi:hypothetical protein